MRSQTCNSTASSVFLVYSNMTGDTKSEERAEVLGQKQLAPRSGTSPVAGFLTRRLMSGPMFLKVRGKGEGGTPQCHENSRGVCRGGPARTHGGSGTKPAEDVVEIQKYRLPRQPRAACVEAGSSTTSYKPPRALIALGMPLGSARPLGLLIGRRPLLWRCLLAKALLFRRG